VRCFDTVDPCPAPTAALVPARTSRDPAAVAFGAAVRATREARGLSVETVARDIPRMDAAYLAAIECGWHAVTIVTAKRIAVALEVPLAELVRDV
jgi:ribosome-binding protein aMBF1 (putative translation factor)